MGDFNSVDEIAEKAFAMAFFIHGNEADAASVVREALGKLAVAAAAQVKRLYYSPTRRPPWRRAAAANSRTKVSLSDLHLLQRLIYVESEPYETAREQRGDGLGEADLLVHFVKHLIRISIKRNSFYVALCVSRLLHNYSTSETMEIYNVVVQDPERVKDDYYYRSRKSLLLQEVKERFGDFLDLCRVSKGEERFQTLDAPGELAGLAAECLRQFSPWHTPCPIPRGYDPTADEIPTLSSAHQAEEDRAEINRIHAVVHPDCYELLTGSLRLEPPALRLSVPRFNLPNGKDNMPGPNDKPRRPAPPLDGNELEALKRILSEQSARRKATHASLLSVSVDGVERSRLDLELSGSAGFAVDDGDELVEVRALDGGGEILLAAHLLGGVSRHGDGPAAKSEIVLEGGQRLTFELSPARGVSNDGAQTFLTVAYRETEWRWAAALLWRRAMRRVTAPGGSGTRPSFVKPALVALFLFVCVGVLTFYVFRKTGGPAATQLAANNGAASFNRAWSDGAPRSTSVTPPAVKPSEGGDRPPENVAVSPQPQSARERGATGKPSRMKHPSQTESARGNVPARAATPAQVASGGAAPDAEGGAGTAREGLDATMDATRSVERNAGATALSKVKKVFIEVTGDDGLSEQTSRLLAGSLRDGRRLTPTDSKDEADAAFKIKVSVRPTAGAARGDKTSHEPDGRPVNVSVRLVNEDGEAIWPLNGKGGAGIYTGTLKGVTGRIAGDLLKAVLKSDAQN
jgi:hypothetical protein